MDFFGSDPPPEMGARIPTPVTETCARCGEAFVEGDKGCAMPLISNEGVSIICYHRNCYLRSVCGSVGHQLGLCSCNGGLIEEVPGMSLRESAAEACRIFEMSFVLGEAQREKPGEIEYTNERWYIRFEHPMADEVAGPFETPSEMCKFWIRGHLQ